MIREIVVDCETTGLDADEHRIIELCAIVLDGTRTGRMWHSWFDPRRSIEPGATAVHGITNDMVKGCDKFRDKADEFLEFVKGSYLIAHNAPFDQGFIESELKRCGKKRTWLKFIDTIQMAKKKLPKKRYSLDALCTHYGISLAGRELHGATLDCKLLAQLYIRLDGRLEQIAFDSTVHYERIHHPGGDTSFLVPSKDPILHPSQRPRPLSSRITEKEETEHRAFTADLEPARQRADALRQLVEELTPKEELFSPPAEVQEEVHDPEPEPIAQPVPRHAREQSGNGSRRLRDRR